MQIKTTIGYHLIPVRKAITKNNIKRWQRCGEEETFVHCWQKCKLVQQYGKQYGGSSKNYK